MARGVPVLNPSKTPLKICALSLSFRGVVNRLPPRLLSSSACKSFLVLKTIICLCCCKKVSYNRFGFPTSETQGATETVHRHHHTQLLPKEAYPNEHTLSHCKITEKKPYSPPYSLDKCSQSTKMPFFTRHTQTIPIIFCKFAPK